MKLKNKKTGEIGKLHFEPDKEYHFTVVTEDPADMEIFKTLAELNEEWEDYEEPRSYWCINWCGGIDEIVCFAAGDTTADKAKKAFGNYFETREEAEKAVEKLKAWKRLKDKGFRFTGWELRPGEGGIIIKGTYGVGIVNELDILFGGEE